MQLQFGCIFNMLIINMGKIFDWLSDSNRWKHLVGGMVVGLGSDDVYCATYAGIGIASALELKDKQWGGEWDWIDWLLTVGGVSIGYAIRFGLIALL